MSARFRALSTVNTNYLKAEAEGLKLQLAEFQKKGQTQPLVSVGDPTEVLISGRRLARVDETWKVNNKAHRMVKLVMAERGYLISFMFADPVGNASDYEAAMKIDTLRFFGSPN